MNLDQAALNKVLKNAGILLSGNIGANLFGLFALAIFTKSQGAVLFGYYALFITFIEIIDRVFNFQTWEAFIKFASDFQIKKEHHNTIMLLKYSFIVDFVSLVVATSIAVALSSSIVEYFKIPQNYYSLLLLMSLTILFKTTEISTGIFRIFDRFKVQAKIAVYSAAIKFAMFGVIALMAPSFQMFVYATVFAQFITMVMKYFYAKSVLNEHGISIKEIVKVKLNISLLKDLKIFSFIVYNNFNVAVRMVSRQLDMIVIGKLYNAEIVGIYKIAKEVANQMAKLTDPVYQSIYPEFAKMLANGKKPKVKKMAIKISLYAGFAGLLMYGIYILLGRFVIEHVFGSDFVGAYEVTLIYFIAIYIAIISLSLYPMQNAFGYAKAAFANQLQATVVYIPTLLLMVFYLEMIGAAIAYIFYYVHLTTLTLNSVKKGYV